MFKFKKGQSVILLIVMVLVLVMLFWLVVLTIKNGGRNMPNITTGISTSSDNSCECDVSKDDLMKDSKVIQIIRNEMVGKFFQKSEIEGICLSVFQSKKGELKGAQGIQGIMGLKGEKGDKGDRGEQGDSVVGLQGPQGIQGVQGLRGEAGQNCQMPCEGYWQTYCLMDHKLSEFNSSCFPNNGKKVTVWNCNN